MNYDRPDVYAEEVAQLETPVTGAPTGFGGMQTVTQRGPVGLAIRTRKIDAWKRVFGGAETRSDAYYEAKAFFDEGGYELITVRQVHYADLADKDSYTGGVANRTASTEGLAATSAEKTGAVQTYELDPGDDIDLDVDNVGVATATFDAASGSVTDTTTYPVADQVGLTLIVSIDGGTNQTVTFGTATTAAQIVSQLNAGLTGCSVVENGGQAQIISDKKGTGSTVAIIGGTSALTWAAAVAGTGDVVDIKAVTAAEIETVIEADTTALVAVNGDGSFTITSPTTGVTSELDFQSGTALTKLGLAVEILVGTAAGATFPTVKLYSGYHGYKSPGIEGNDYKTLLTKDPLHPTEGVGNDLAVDIAISDTTFELSSLVGLAEKSIIKIWDGTNTEYFEVAKVRSEVSGGTVKFYVDVTAGSTYVFTAAAAQIESREFSLVTYRGSDIVETKPSLDQMSMLSTADNYYLTQINDENVGSEFVVAESLSPAVVVGADLPASDTASVALTGGTDETIGLVDTDWVGDQSGKTGLYAWDEINEFMPLATPGNNSTLVFNAATVYCANRMWFEYLGFVDEGMSASDAVAYRQNILGVDSKYSVLYAGGIKVYDPAVSGSNPTRNIAGIGAMMGIRSRVDTLPDPNGGPWQAPAGDGDYGVVRSASDVVTKYDDSDADLMNPAGINLIRKFTRTGPVTVWGSRTLYRKPDKKWIYINTSRSFMFYEKSIVDGTRWAVHRNNDFRLWGRLKDSVDTFLAGLMPQGAFPTNLKEQAYFIKVGIDDGVMTAGDRDDGKVVGEIGIAEQKTGEFIIWRFSQFDSGFDVQEQ